MSEVTYGPRKSRHRMSDMLADFRYKLTDR